MPEGGSNKGGSHARSRGGLNLNLNSLLGFRMRRLLLLLSFLDTLCTRVGISQGHNNQGFISDHEVRYTMGDDVQSGTQFVADSPPPITGGDSKTIDNDRILTFPVRFEPPELDFQHQPIGLPVLRKVTVFNLNAQSSIQMLSISGNTIHFHCSFFADKVIPPSGNTSFDVVFLGRDEGVVENTLYIHTSAGSFRFHVKATGTPNPYRLKPLVGVKMPLNSSYSPMIQLHNPHPEPIQVLEMYSSGGDLHLELPGGENEGPQTLWQIPPYQTKSVMKANFLARLENNHTAYIRIKTNTTGPDFLYLPLEVEVSSQPGIYCPQEVVDFGLLPSNSQPKTKKLLLLNSGQKAIAVQNVIATPVTEALTVSFRPQKISPDTLRPATIAEVTFDPSLVPEDGFYTGKFVVKSKNSQFKVTIPYNAQVLTGKLTVVDEGITRFHLKDANAVDNDVIISGKGRSGGGNDVIGDPGESSSKTKEINSSNKMARNLTLRNSFRVAVAVHNVTLAPEATKFFRLTNFSPTVLGAGATKDLLELSLKREAWRTRLLDSHLTLHTNISSINIPLICFHGLMEKYLPDSPGGGGGGGGGSQDAADDVDGGYDLDFGTLGMAEKRDLYFTVLNRNPVTLNLKNWGANLTGSLLELMGVEKGGEGEVMRRANFSGMHRSLAIPPDHYMVFRVGIFAPTQEGETNATVFVETEYQKLDIHFKFRVAKGSLSTVPAELIFDQAFPGKSVKLKLKVFSSFLEEMITDSVTTKPFNNQFSFKHTVTSGRSSITSSEKSFIGHVVFDPSADCRKDESCYSGFQINTKLGRGWFQSSSLHGRVAESDAAIAHALYNRFRASTTPSPSFNITLNLDTNKVRGFLFKARAKLIWPRTTVPEEGRFPLTAVGNSSTLEVFVHNPSDHLLYVHLVPFAAYPDADTMIKRLMPSWAMAHLNGNINNLTSDGSGGGGGANAQSAAAAAAAAAAAFKILNVQDDNGTLIGLTEEVERKTGHALNANTKAFKLMAGHRARVRLKFQPEFVGDNFRHGIFVRNNLTGIEMVTFAATSVNGEFKFGKFKHNHQSPEDMVLEFDMREKRLEDCDRPRQSRYSSPVLSVKRSIELENTGAAALYISGFELEGVPCEGYGFRVLDCDGFDLKPAETREIDIAFSPDFTLTKVTRRLTILSNVAPEHQGLVNYTLVATLPPHMLAVCGSVIPRPSWETYLYHVVNVVMGLVLVIVLISAFMESDRIIRFTYGSGYQPPLLVQNSQAKTTPSVASSNSQQQGAAAVAAAAGGGGGGGQVFDLRNVAGQVSQELREPPKAAAAAAAVNGGASGSGAAAGAANEVRRRPVQSAAVRRRSQSLFFTGNGVSSSGGGDNDSSSNSGSDTSNGDASHDNSCTATAAGSGAQPAEPGFASRFYSYATDAFYSTIKAVLASARRTVEQGAANTATSNGSGQTRRTEQLGETTPSRGTAAGAAGAAAVVVGAAAPGDNCSRASASPNTGRRKNNKANNSKANSKKKGHQQQPAARRQAPVPPAPPAAPSASSTNNLEDLETSSTTTESSNQDESFNDREHNLSATSPDEGHGKKNKVKKAATAKALPSTAQDKAEASSKKAVATSQHQQPVNKQLCKRESKADYISPVVIAAGAAAAAATTTKSDKKSSVAVTKSSAPPQPPTPPPPSMADIAKQKKTNGKQQQQLAASKGKSLDAEFASYGTPDRGPVRNSSVTPPLSRSSPPLPTRPSPPPGLPAIAKTANAAREATPSPSEQQQQGFFSSVNLQQPSKAKKVSNVPVGKILPEVKKPENKFGPVGAKPNILSPSLKRGGVWGCEDAFPAAVGPGGDAGAAVPVAPPTFQGLSSPAATAAPNFDQRRSVTVTAAASGAGSTNAIVPPPPGFSSQRQFVQDQVSPNRTAGGNMSAFAGPDSGGLTGFAASGLTGFQQGELRQQQQQQQQLVQQESLMTSLQKERRLMTEEYLSKTREQTDWPGFDTASTIRLGGPDFIASLWDESSSAVGGSGGGGGSAVGASGDHLDLNIGRGMGSGAAAAATTGGWGTSFNPVWTPPTSSPYWQPGLNASSNSSGVGNGGGRIHNGGNGNSFGGLVGDRFRTTAAAGGAAVSGAPGGRSDNNVLGLDVGLSAIWGNDPPPQQQQQHLPSQVQQRQQQQQQQQQAPPTTTHRDAWGAVFRNPPKK